MQRLKRDEGAVAVMVAILMVALLGFGTLVLDVGQIYAERRQLQNGADAAVLSLAMDCPTAATCATAAASVKANDKADQNANDGAASVASPSGPAICGVGGGLPACSPVSGIGDWDCRPVPAGPLATNYVQVRTQTEASGGGNLVPPFLAQVLAPGYTGSTVRACARASWGAPSALNAALALTISFCEWEEATAGGYAPSPPYPPTPAASFDRKLSLHDPGGTTTACPAAGHSGFDAPGAFGWLDDPTNSCETYIDSTGVYGADTGVGVSSSCKTALELARTNRTVNYIPIYQNATGTGSSSTYTLKGFAAFVVTGYRLPGLSDKSWVTNTFCGPAASKCISGFFTKALTPTTGTIGTGPYMGVSVVQMSG